jgi:hypothetical protein
MNTRRHLVAFAAIWLVLGTGTAHAVMITSQTLVSGSQFAYPGQSLTTPMGGPWNNITFDFLTSDATPIAGALFILTQEYLGTPAALSSSTAGFVAQSTGIVNDEWTFAPSLTLAGNTQYWFYGNAQLPKILVSLSNPLPAETA